MQAGFDFIGVSVVTMCHDGAGKYLMSQRGAGCRDEHGVWEPAGGGAVHMNESLEEAARREVYEECGAYVDELEFLGFREVFRETDNQKSHWIAFDYRGRIDPSDVRNTEPEKCSELRWCTIDEIPSPRHSQFSVFLEKYAGRL
jgi:ADP-ribose pyrophosphatase YjhB (NUDIX family)